MRAPVLAVALVWAVPAWADSHGITVQNGTAETIRSIVVSATAGSGENRLRSTLPPGASGRIVYSTGCQANVRIGYEGGRTEDHAGVDVCSDPRIIAGTNGVAGPAMAAAAPGAASPNAASPSPASPSPASPAPTRPGKPGAATPVSTQPVKAPPPVVPPWTGKSITKRFGGMD